ncbi:MAG TPA: HAMP domain-containing sensor histidine kinase [Solirubrobacteraceae bacterium]|nr:HAMP domain-containing sensor histidine kinase [Solirubrobacteraceae bacterium]
MARLRMPLAPRLRAHRLRGRPRRTIRLRLTALYGSVFLFSSATLLTIGYLVARSTLLTRHPMLDALRRLGFHPRSEYHGFRPGSHNARLVHAVELNIVRGTLHRLLVEYVVALLATTAIAVITGWLLAGRALAPLRRITATARRVSGENLGERIALQGPDDELKVLANTFDRMLERLDGAFASQRHFVASASHELRTPLAIMRTEIDVALADPDAGAVELRAMAEAVRETVDRCESLIASLLVLARSEATSGRREPLDLAVLAADCVTDLSAPAREARIEVRTDLAEAWIDGDPSLVERMVANLLDNGIRHNEPGGWLSVSTEMRERSAVLRVANGGPPIDRAAAAGLTEPFRRLSHSVPGFGLGLSIVRAIAVAHGGEAVVAPRAQGGLEVTVALPGRTRAPRPRPPAGDSAPPPRGTVPRARI